MQKLKKRIRTRQFWLALAPLIVVLVALGVYNLTIASQTTTAVATNPTPTRRPTRTPFPDGTRPPILLATILPSPTPTITPRPDVPQTAVITLFGPPDSSSLSQDGQLTFFWTYSEPLPARQQFVLTLHQNGITTVLGMIAQPNFGDAYQLSVNFDAVELEVGTAVWQLQLQWIDEERPLLASEEREITFIRE